jgi:flagellar hook-length control protein FliK
LREDKPHLHALVPPSVGIAGAVDGTAAAKEQLPMKIADEMEESAEPAVKNLPGAERGLEVPAARVISRVEETRAARRDFQIDPAVSQFSATNTLSSGAATSTASTTSASDVPAVERVARAVMEGVAQLRHTGNESVTVVLKPDAGTELLLRVEMRDGALSAQLHFERGDRGALDQHLDELQRRLAEQGVRLSRTEDAGMSGDAQFAKSQRQPLLPEDDSTANHSSSFTKNISHNQTVTRRSARGFETWA